MRTSVVFIIFVVAWAACTRKNHVPAGIIPQDKMQDLMWDVMVADAYSSNILAMDTLKKKNLKKERSVAYQQVFEYNHTSREEFIKSFNYYTAHPELTKILFDTLAIRANRKREDGFRLRVPARKR